MTIEPEMKVYNCTDPEQNPAAGWKVAATPRVVPQEAADQPIVRYPAFCRPLNRSAG